MQFFDDKQEVLDIVITPYGESLLAKGRFSPEYYAFFDDDILYDAEWTGLTTEVQNDIEGRIQQETPRVKQPSVYTGVGTAINQINADIRQLLEDEGFTGPNAAVAQDTHNSPLYNQDSFQNFGDKFDFLSKPLGRSALTSKKYPSWTVSMLKGEISSSQHYTETPRGFEKIPQINIDLNYKLFVSKTDEPAVQFNNATAQYSNVLFPIGSTVATNLQPADVVMPPEFENIISRVFQDGTYFSLTKGGIILDVLEENVDFKKENFEIQVFISSSTYNGPNGEPMQLYYSNEIENLKYNDVEKYLTIRVDREINNARVRDIPQITDNRLTADPNVTNVISTREFLLRDLYDPDPDICE